MAARPGGGLRGPVAGYYVPGLGRSATTEWTIEGGHLAERCQLFVIIALGESILVTGTTFGEIEASTATVAAFVVAFLGSVALWWIYFDRSAEAAGEVIVLRRGPGAAGALRLHLLPPADGGRDHRGRRRRRADRRASRRARNGSPLSR